jgi:hypothetical protein
VEAPKPLIRLLPPVCRAAGDARRLHHFRGVLDAFRSGVSPCLFEFLLLASQVLALAFEMLAFALFVSTTKTRQMISSYPSIGLPPPPHPSSHPSCLAIPLPATTASARLEGRPHDAQVLLSRPDNRSSTFSTLTFYLARTTTTRRTLTGGRPRCRPPYLARCGSLQAAATPPPTPAASL